MTPEEAKTLIEDKVKTNDVVLFMKGNKDFPMCGFSGRVTQILTAMQVNFEDINILENETLRQSIKDYSKWPTVPQLYVKGEFVGGCDIICEMLESGELYDMFKNKNIAHSEVQLS